MLDNIKDFLTLGFLFPIIILFGTFLSIKLRWLQIFRLKESFSLVMAKEKKEGISSFQALSAVLGGNLGTGNISGVAVALLTGGPGSIFWMWVMAILASITKYVDSFLGVHYQKQDDKKEWVSGPMYYIKSGLHNENLAKLFCIFTIFSALFVGNLAQVHALSLPFLELSIPPFLLGMIIAFLVASVVLGGLKRFARVAESVVPFMAVFYILGCLVVLISFKSEIIPSLKLIFENAFSLKPVSGGLFGYSIFLAIRSGFDRGLFATDSGIGLSAILHGAVREENPKFDNRVKQGLISILSPIIVMLVCTMTALVLLSSKAFLMENILSTTMCMKAFEKGFGFPLAGHLVTITLFFFAFTTILTWSFCADKAIEFLLGTKYIKYFQIIFILFIPLGSLITQNFVWTIADISINIMFLINMIALFKLYKLVLKHS